MRHPTDFRLMRLGATLLVLACTTFMIVAGFQAGWPVWLRIVGNICYGGLGIASGVLMVLHGVRRARRTAPRTSASPHSSST